MPFGVKEPDAWRWRVSRDVRTTLLRPVYIDGTDTMVGRLSSLVVGGRETVVPERLLGIVVEVDEKLPPRSIVLDG